jgi:CRP-like cAMP-binding protein
MPAESCTLRLNSSVTHGPKPAAWREALRYRLAMHDDLGADGLRQRLAKSGEDALGRLAQDLLENPLVTSALSRAFEAREKAAQAQEAAMGALNIPSASDIERLTRRIRQVSQRLEGIEDGVDRLDGRLAALNAAPNANPGLEDRLSAIDEQLAAIARELGAMQQALPGTAAPVPRNQERLAVSEE